MAGSNLDELCLFTVYHTSLARVAAFGVQGGLGLKRLMMLSRYESGIPKALGRGNLLRSFERHTCTHRSWLRVQFVLFSGVMLHLETLSPSHLSVGCP
jgi:hypothetical protein